MADLNRELAEARDEVQDIKTLLREEISELFAFDVAVGSVNYNDTKNSATVTVEPSSEARKQLSERLGGVNAQIDGQLDFEFGFASDPDGA